MLNYTNELALPNISGFTKQRGRGARWGEWWKGDSFVMRSNRSRRGSGERNRKEQEKRKRKNNMNDETMK